MMNVKDVDQYYRYGRGKLIDFLITDEELSETLNQTLNSTFYQLIYRQNYDEHTYSYQKALLTDYLSLRQKRVKDFYIIDVTLTPKIELPMSPINVYGSKPDWDKYFTYIGLPYIMYDINSEDKFSAIIFGHIDRYTCLDNPSRVYHNEGYTKLYLTLSRKIKKLLKYKRISTYKDGSINTSKIPFISEAFAKAVESSRVQMLGDVAEW